MRTYAGSTGDVTGRFAIVGARFNETVTARLVEGAVAGFVAHGVAQDRVDIAWVPGAFEIPLVADRLAQSGRYVAVVCLGAVIRGETAHFELVAAEAARGVGEAGRRAGVPCVFEVLATENLAQAEARAGGSNGNKGWEAAEVALEMASLLEGLPATAGDAP